MVISCPHCPEEAELFLALMEKNDRFDEPKNDWRIECPACGATLEGRFQPVLKLLLSLIFLTPVAVSWTLFLLYARSLGTGWLAFFLFLIHIGVGLSAGMYLSEMGAFTILSRRSGRQ